VPYIEEEIVTKTVLRKEPFYRNKEVEEMTYEIEEY